MESFPAPFVTLTWSTPGCDLAPSMGFLCRRAARRLWCSLALLQLRLLGRVFLLDLLGLLRVTLLHLRLLCVVIVFLGRLLMFLFLLLLELLVILRLLRSQLVLLLLVFLVGFGVAGIWRRSFVRLQFARVIAGGRMSFGSILCVIVSGGTRLILGMRFIAPGGIRRRSLIFAARLFGSHNACFEIARFGCGRNRRLALVGGGA